MNLPVVLLEMWVLEFVGSALPDLNRSIIDGFIIKFIPFVYLLSMHLILPVLIQARHPGHKILHFLRWLEKLKYFHTMQPGVDRRFACIQLKNHRRMNHLPRLGQPPLPGKLGFPTCLGGSIIQVLATFSPFYHHNFTSVICDGFHHLPQISAPAMK